MTEMYLLVFAIRVSSTLIVGMSVQKAGYKLILFNFGITFSNHSSVFIVHQMMVYKNFLYSAAETIGG